ncbi:hypothetical protein [Dehalobacter sp.]|uniref:hypothetical protein n=1 Tax=Dehalobacter sp. TaxID=1962289 RepID=UPI00258C5476|nr:hypothetical protein [Dehalobacter sp.]MDJ0306780.1 hypothetical protein [Dehalobacter sp.]
MRRKGLFVTLTLSFILLCSSVAYAASFSYCYGVFYHTDSQIQSYVVTGIDSVVDSIQQKGWLYMDGNYVQYNISGSFNSTYSQTPVFYSNPAGLQDWDLDGWHTATDNGITLGSRDSISYAEI